MHVAPGLSHRPAPVEPMDTTVSRAPKAHGKPAPKDAGGIAVVDTIDLSAEAKAVLESADQPSGPGKSARSTAHRARALIAEHPHLAGLSFGQVVSGLNHGTLDLTPPPAPPTDGETDPVVATDAEDGDAGAAPVPERDATAAADTPEGEIDGAAPVPVLAQTVDVDSALFDLIDGIGGT